jgi:tRNA-specific adenosine deaminase 2
MSTGPCEACGHPYVAEHMEAAFRAAQAALLEGEVAVGCVLVHTATSQVVAMGFNHTNRDKHALSHAEFVAVGALQQSLAPLALSSLEEYELYVTVEPCMMCAAMLALNRVGHVFYGCSNPRFGGNGGVLSVHSSIYCSCGDRQADRAVKLLQNFYEQENDAAPDHKRRRKDDEGKDD